MDGKFVTNNAKETVNLGMKFAKTLKPGDAVLLIGELGAGKTTFVQGLAKALGITERILSPTFVLQRVHEAPVGKIKTLNHIDLYRLEAKQQIDSLGLAETVDDPEGVTIIEWADRLTDFKPRQGYSLRFEYLGEDRRQIEITKL